MSPAKTEFTCKEIVKLTHVTLRQLQYWDENDYIRPKQDRHRRLYTPEQVSDIQRYAKLRKAGVTCHRATRLMRNGVDIEALAAAIRTVRAAGLKVR